MYNQQSVTTQYRGYTLAIKTHYHTVDGGKVTEVSVIFDAELANEDNWYCKHYKNLDDAIKAINNDIESVE